MHKNFSIIKISLLCSFVFLMACGICFGDASQLEVGDRIGITVGEEAELNKIYELDADGNIILPLGLGKINLLGKNTSEAAEIVRESLETILVNPTVIVTFVDRAKMRIFVVGQVMNKGLLEIGKGDRVVQAIAEAGYDATSDLSNVTVQRGEEVINLNLKKYVDGEDLTCNIVLQSGDTVVVAKVRDFGSVMVLGQVTKVGELPLTTPTITFREVMGFIGGVAVTGDTENITVKKKDSEEQIKIDYVQAMNNDPIANIELSDGDMIYVPEIETYFFSIMGLVKGPGQFPLRSRLTLTEAIALAGGHISESNLEKVRITHTNSDGSAADTAEYNVRDIIDGIADDPLVKRGDVIYVPQRKRTIFQNIGYFLTTISPLRWFVGNW